MVQQTILSQLVGLVALIATCWVLGLGMSMITFGQHRRYLAWSRRLVTWPFRTAWRNIRQWAQRFWRRHGRVVVALVIGITIGIFLIVWYQTWAASLQPPP